MSLTIDKRSDDSKILSEAAAMSWSLGIPATSEYPFIELFDADSTVERVTDIARFIESKYPRIQFDSKASYPTRDALGPSIVGVIR